MYRWTATNDTVVTHSTKRILLRSNYTGSTQWKKATSKKFLLRSAEIPVQLFTFRTTVVQWTHYSIRRLIFNRLTPSVFINPFLQEKQQKSGILIRHPFNSFVFIFFNSRNFNFENSFRNKKIQLSKCSNRLSPVTRTATFSFFFVIVKRKKIVFENNNWNGACYCLFESAFGWNIITKRK